jgi:hypothetical protein
MLLLGRQWVGERRQLILCAFVLACVRRRQRPNTGRAFARRKYALVTTFRRKKERTIVGVTHVLGLFARERER